MQQQEIFFFTEICLFKILLHGVSVHEIEETVFKSFLHSFACLFQS